MVAPWVLSLWLITLLLLFLYPCCESIAATVPHDHASSTELLHEHTQATHSHYSDALELISHEQNTSIEFAKPQIHDHLHCGSVDLDQVEYDALLPTEINKPDNSKKLYAIYPESLSTGSLLLASTFIYNKFYSPPDIKLRVYLKTERLRI